MTNENDKIDKQRAYLKCLRCHYSWLPRHPADGIPRQCPRCKSPMWDKPLKYKKAGKWADVAAGLDRKHGGKKDKLSIPIFPDPVKT